MAAKDFFDSLESRADAAKLAGHDATRTCSTSRAKASGTSTCATARSRSPRAAAKPTPRSPRRARRSQKIVAGEQNPTTAYMTGKLKIKGDMGAAMKLQKLF